MYVTNTTPGSSLLHKVETAVSCASRSVAPIGFHSWRAHPLRLGVSPGPNYSTQLPFSKQGANHRNIPQGFPQ